MQFVKGMDVSMLKELEQHGAVYYLNGEERDLFKIMKVSGANLVRLRLWNSPYSETGEPYGGGTNDFETTLELAKRADTQGLDIMLDFHYSDFWADPAKQFKPKAWENLKPEQLKEAVYCYTRDILNKMKQQNINPVVVQVGNEITNGLLWPEGRVENLEMMAELLKSGIRGVRETVPDAKILLHLDFGTDNKLYRRWFGAIEPYQLDFDMIGMSYYPFWNGSLESLIYNMNDISRTYDKDVLVAETSIGYTTDTLGCNGIVFSEELEKNTEYPATKEGQELFLKDLCKAVRNVENGRGVGIVYWEPEWLPIPECAWAKKIGCEYMNDKAELGNSWANQALFDAEGNANQALINLGTM